MVIIIENFGAIPARLMATQQMKQEKIRKRKIKTNGRATAASIKSVASTN